MAASRYDLLAIVFLLAACQTGARQPETPQQARDRAIRAHCENVAQAEYMHQHRLMQRDSLAVSGVVAGQAAAAAVKAARGGLAMSKVRSAGLGLPPGAQAALRRAWAAAR